MSITRLVLYTAVALLLAIGAIRAIGRAYDATAPARIGPEPARAR